MKFQHMNWQQRLATITAKADLTKAETELFSANINPINEQMIENYVTSFQLPQGILPSLIVNGHDYQVPMVTEEPSVIAAAANGARMIALGGGVQAHVVAREMIGQVMISNTSYAEIRALITDNFAELINLGNLAYPSMVKRGGGLKDIDVRDLADGFVAVDLIIDTKEAMGANVVNTISEAIANFFKDCHVGNVVMAILSNLATEALVNVTVALPFSAIAKTGFDAAQIAAQIVLANEFSQRDSYRSATENKGIMNGIDAVVMATGNDWRAISAGIHAYAAQDGTYRNLVTWQKDTTHLYGELTVPLPVGTVGGSIGVVPLVQANHKILGNPNAIELAQVIASVGLAQNLAALRALVTSGIQAGHMQLQFKSLALAVGAKVSEVPELAKKLAQLKHADTKSAQQLLIEMRETK